MSRPKPESQSGRILALLESRNGGKVYLPEILVLRISQYSARIFDLRHKYQFQIENGSEPGRPDHTWFRLVVPTSAPIDANVLSQPSHPVGSINRSDLLFCAAELERTAQWEDLG